MQADALAPAVGQRRCLVVPTQQLIQVRAAKEVKHREIGLGMTAASHGVNERGARGVLRIGIPQQVSCPEVAVETRNLMSLRPH